MRRILFRGNGCEQRGLEAVYFQQLALMAGDTVVFNEKDADLVLYTSCCVSLSAYKLALKEIYDLRVKGLMVVIYGCLPGIEHRSLIREGFISFTVCQKDQLRAYMGWSQDVAFPVLTNTDIPNIAIEGKSPRTQFEIAKRGKKIVISNGCLNQCAYCVIRYAAGRLKSRPIDEIKQQWIKEILIGDHVMLMGGDTGAYGMDLGTNLPELLRELQSTKIFADIYLHDLNVRWMRKYLAQFCNIASPLNWIRGLTLPIQSGSDYVLKRMRRCYTSEDIRVCFQRIHMTNPKMIMGTHIIVGFPGESEKCFRETMDLLQEIPIDFISCFPYSEHKMADSKQMEPKIKDDIILARLEYLKIAFGEKIKIYS